MQPYILRTKLKPPRVAPDILPRARLLDMLNEGRRRTLTLISAPAGYGKSTLACRWVDACGWPCGWVSLDESDSDLRMFLSYVLAAIQSLFPETELSAEVFLESDQKPSVSVLARYLLNDLDQISDPFILVLDDYHLITGRSSVHDLLMEVLAHPPRTMHLALLTRRDPPFSISKMRGNGQVTEIRASDLRFTPAEVSAFFNEQLNIPVDDATTRLLDEKMEGWVTGLRLAGLYLRDKDDLKNRVQELSGGVSNIAEYLIEEVLSKQNPEISAFLVETSILNRFCAPLCQAVHSKRVEERRVEKDFDAQRFIKRLVDANLFVIPLDDEGNWFRYHHLFQGFLQGLLRKQSNADTIAGLHLRASNWFADNGLIEEAIQYALAAGDSRVAVRLVLEHRYDLMNTAQFLRLQGWLALLPDDVVSKTPLLVSTKAFIGIEQGQDTDVYTCTQQAELMLERFPPESAEYGILKSEVYVLKGFIDMAVGNPGSGLAHAEEALESTDLSADAALIRSLGILTEAFCQQMMGNHRQGITVIEKALLNPAWNPNIRARLHFYLSIVHYMNANLAGAIASSSECQLSVRELSFSHTRTFASYLLGAAYYWRNELAEAERHLMSVLDDFEPNNPSYVSNAAFVLACICLERDCKKESEQILSKVSAHFQANNYITIMAIIRAFQVELSLRQGDIERARDISKKVVFDMRPPLWFFYVPQLTPIKLLLAEGTDESLNEARTRLAELDEQMGRINRKNVRIDVLVLMALVCHELGDEETALKHLQSALDLAQPGGWIRNFVDLGDPMTALLERLIQLRPGHTYTKQVLDACRADASGKPTSDRVAEKTSSLSGQAAAPILSNREIDILHLLADGLSNKEIAFRLYISPDTVKTHLQNIYRKLDAKGGRVAALKTARMLGLIAPD